MTTLVKKLQQEDYARYFDQAISYEQYKLNFEAEMQSEDASPYTQYLPQNWQRQARLDRKLKLRDDVLESLESINTDIKWLLITEHWCGDASQINPVIAKVAEASKGRIDLRLIYRDEHEDLIDAHLTDGRSRSIPILLQFDASFKLLGSYGPRPEEAQQLVKSLLAEGSSYSVPVHTWYARNKQQDIQDDIIELLKRNS